MGAAAVAAARAAGYRNAGTIEFLLEGEGNDAPVLLPRDEHAAAGRASGDGSGDRRRPGAARSWRLPRAAPLPWAQESLGQRGHAIECRDLCGGSVVGFLPQAGPLLLYREPSGRASASTPGSSRGTRLASTTTRCSPSSWPPRRPGPPRCSAPSQRCAPFRSSASAPTFRSCSACSSTPTSCVARRTRRFIDERLAELTAPAKPPPAAIAAAAIADRAGVRAAATQAIDGDPPSADPWARLENWGR